MSLRAKPKSLQRPQVMWFYYIALYIPPHPRFTPLQSYWPSCSLDQVHTHPRTCVLAASCLGSFSHISPWLTTHILQFCTKLHSQWGLTLLLFYVEFQHPLEYYLSFLPAFFSCIEIIPSNVLYCLPTCFIYSLLLSLGCKLHEERAGAFVYLLMYPQG